MPEGVDCFVIYICPGQSCTMQLLLVKIYICIMLMCIFCMSSKTALYRVAVVCLVLLVLLYSVNISATHFTDIQVKY